MPQCGTNSVSTLIQGTILKEAQTENASSLAGLPNSGYLVSTKGIQMSRKCPASQHCQSRDERQVDKMNIMAKLNNVIFMGCGFGGPVRDKKRKITRG